MTDSRTNEPTPEQVEAAAVASINSHRSRAGLPLLAALDGVPNADEWRDDARAALEAAQDAEPQAESGDCDRDRMGICKRCGMGWDARKALDGDLACPVLPSSPESPAQAFADWHERWWRNEPNTIAKANAQAAFFAGWDARGAAPHRPVIDREKLIDVLGTITYRKDGKTYLLSVPSDHAEWVEEMLSLDREAVERAAAEKAWQEGAEAAFYDPYIRGFIDYPENPYGEINEKL